MLVTRRHDGARTALMLIAFGLFACVVIPTAIFVVVALLPLFIVFCLSWLAML